jgi:quercetin dioxygenase-like cupin family protein
MTTATTGLLEKKRFEETTDRRAFPHGKAEVLQAGPATLMLVTFEPGWRWSTAVKPIAKTESCQVPHVNYVLSGRIGIQMDNGTAAEYGPGDVAVIPPGHDAWVVGDEQFVALDIIAGTEYAVSRG